MSNIPFRKPKESSHPLIREFDDFFKKDLTFDERQELIFDFYKRNLDFVNNLGNANSNLTISKFIELKITYIRVLDNQGEYKNGKPVADHINILLGKLDKSYNRYGSLYLNGSKWIAINLGRLKKYRASNKIFKELIHLDENKEFYQRWIAGNLGKIINPFIYILLGLSLAFAFRKDLLGINFHVPKFVLVCVIILIILTVLYDFYSEKILTFYVERKYSKPRDI